MIEFFFPNSGALLRKFCPLSVQIAQMGLILPRWGLILPRIPPPSPLLYSAVTKPLLGVCTKHPKTHPTPPWPEHASGQNELQYGQNGPQLDKMFEK